MSKVLRVAIAVIAAILLVGASTLPTPTSQVNWEQADPNAPDGG